MWQYCGEGFQGYLVSNVGDHTSMKNEKKNNSESIIVADVKPEGKESDKKCKKQNVFSEATWNVGSKSELSNAAWKHGDFMEEFTIKQEKTPQESVDINWSSSSSDECLPTESNTHNMNRVSKTFSIRKRKLHSPNITSNILVHTDKAQLSTFDPSDYKSRKLSVCSENFVSSQHRNPCHGGSQSNKKHSESIAENVDSTLIKDMPMLITSCHSKLSQKIHRKQNEISWTLPSFDEVSHAATTAAAKKGNLLVAGNFKLKKSNDSLFQRKGKRLKSRVVRRLCVGESLESFGQISDVESDLDEIDIDASHDVEESDDEVLQRVNPCSRDVEPELGQDAALQTDMQELQNSQIHISCGTSSSDSSAQSEKMRASDWIKVLQLQKTPLKIDQEKNSHKDSSKKKQKFPRGSMANQLSCLIKRERASVQFWYHSVRGGTFDEKSNKSLVLKLLSLEKQYSVVMSRCDLIEESADAMPCNAVFMCETVKKLCLTPGMTVQVFAPWNQLEESDGTRTILCTHFVKVLSVLNPNTNEVNKNGVKLSASAVWSCPCSTDSRMSSHLCPAASTPELTSNVLQMVGSPGPNFLPSARLQMVTAVTHHPCPGAVSRRTLLESIEAMRCDGSVLPPFTASVLRVFRHRVRETLKRRLQLLVEDSAGMLAIVTFSDEFSAIPMSICSAGGKTCAFSCLHVASRTNKDRDPALFGIVDQVWRQQFLSASSQQSGSETSQLQLRTVAPSFAYVLRSASAETCVSALEQDDSTKEMLTLLMLDQVVQIESETRVTFIAKLLLPPRFTQVSGPACVHVYDSSVDKEGMTTIQKLEIISECLMECSGTNIYLFRDVLVREGHWYCDSYTLVLDMPAWTMWDVHNKLDSTILASVPSSSIKLPAVCGLSKPGQFVSIEGMISEIDEELSYSWEECDVCGTDRLTTSEESGTTYCTSCNRQVMSPVFRIKMEVYVTCLSSHLVVKVDLAQKTIESLLPAEYSEEGHDTQLVIGKPLKCPACLVQSQAHPDYSADTSKDFRTILMLMELHC